MTAITSLLIRTGEPTLSAIWNETSAKKQRWKGKILLDDWTTGTVHAPLGQLEAKGDLWLGDPGRTSVTSEKKKFPGLPEMGRRCCRRG